MAKTLSDDPQAVYMRAYRQRMGEEFDRKKAEYSRIYRLANLKEIKAQQARYRAANKAKIAAYQKISYQKNKEAKRIYDEVYRAKTVETRAAYQAVWRIDNAHVKAAHCRNRKARVRGAEGKHTAKEVKAMFMEQGGLCKICSADLSTGFHADHIVAIINGGSNWISNIQLLCPPCNLSKFTKDNDTFVAARRSRSSVG